jgi:hypothetical protein
MPCAEIEHGCHGTRNSQRVCDTFAASGIGFQAVGEVAELDFARRIDISETATMATLLTPSESSSTISIQRTHLCFDQGLCLRHECSGYAVGSERRQRRPA